MKKLFTAFFALITLCSSADSPLTSTFFAMAYNDVPIIGAMMQRRMTEGIYNLPLTKEQIAFLDDVSISLDQKVALINGLGWGETANTEVYIQHLMQKYAIDHAVLDSAFVPREVDLYGLWPAARVISNDDLVILSYLQIMGDYFQPLKGLNCAVHALDNNPTSEATAYVTGLLAAQLYLESNWCAVYLVMEEVGIAAYEKDFMREDAVLAIMEYISLYQSSCEEEELNSFYDTPVRLEWTPEYWTNNPCYKQPTAPQQSNAKGTVDLELLNDETGAEVIYTNWINYDESINGTSVVLKIRNNGTSASIPTNVAMIINEDEDDDLLEPIMVQSAIPAIPAGSTIDVTISIDNYWIYNPDASFDVEIDFDNNIKEENEENNKKWFFEQG
ncbi:MAG: CARDB domain-containing protein [Flavobacteriales bacterium]